MITPASLKAGLGRAGVKLRRHECLELFSEYDTEMRGRLGEDAAAGLIARVRAGEFGGVADAAGRDGYVREAPPPPPSSPFKSAADDGAGAAPAETGTLAIGVLKGAKLAKKMLALLTRGVACKLVERDDDGDDADVFARADAGFARADRARRRRRRRRARVELRVRRLGVARLRPRAAADTSVRLRQRGRRRGRVR